MTTISVIITTRNSAATLEDCLQSVKDQTTAVAEIIVVDRDSIDTTKEIAKKYTSLVYNQGPERSRQRNFGAKKAVGNYLLFVDSDMKLDKRVISDLVRSIKDDKDIRAIIIPEESFGQGYWARVKAFERSFYLGDDQIEAPRLIEKEIFQTVGGYDETMVAGEDWDLHRRLKKVGAKISRIKVPIYHNEGDLNLVKAIGKKYFYGTKISAYFKKNQPQFSQVSPLRVSFVKNFGRLIKNPSLTLGLVVLKMAELVAAAIGLLVSLISRQK